MVSDRGLPPHDMAAEEAVLGSALIDGSAIDVLADILRPSDFYGEKNRICYEGMLALSGRSEPINQITLAHELSDGGRLEDIGGAAYLAHLVMITPSSASVKHYGRIVRRESLSRDLIDAGLRIVDIGYMGGADGAAALARAERALSEARSDWGGGGFRHIRDVLDEYLASFGENAEDAAVRAARVPLGYAGLDNLLGGGLAPSDMAIIAARPSFGKSAFAFTAARRAAGLGFSAGIFSLEMSIDQIGMRVLSAECEIDAFRLRSGLMSDAESVRLMDAVGDISDLAIWVDDSPIQTVAEMRARARRLQAESGLDLIIVDYIQLIGGGGRRENRAVELGEVSRGLKAMARELNAPALVCSQLSRAIEQRPSKRPLLSDLRESGSIEQDADVVAFLHREDMYIRREEWERVNPTDPYPENMAEVIVAKHRNGPVGSALLHFKKEFARFDDLGV